MKKSKSTEKKLKRFNCIRVDRKMAVFDLKLQCILHSLSSSHVKVMHILLEDI